LSTYSPRTKCSPKAPSSPRPDLNAADKREIGNILLYFQRRHGLGRLAVLPDGFELPDMENVFGFTLQAYTAPSPAQYYHYSLPMPWPPLAVDDFDYCFTVTPWAGGSQSVNRYRLDYDPAEFRLVLSEAGTAVLTVDIASLARDIHTRNRAQSAAGKESLGPDDLTFRGENNAVRYAVLFTGITMFEATAEARPENVEFLFFVGGR
jgi:hypothetical protein